MARILAISSYVAFGHVGLSAIQPALQAMDHEVIAVPSVVLSNHYGYRHVGGAPVSAQDLTAILEGLAANGWMEDVEAIISGYLPSPEHVSVLAKTVEGLRSKSPDIVYLCDPVIGDDPGGLYVSEELARAVKDRLVPLADIITPNRFELSWLTGTDLRDSEAVAEAITASDGFCSQQAVITTSVPSLEGRIENVLLSEEGKHVTSAAFTDGVPHGTGDLFAALYLGNLLHSRSQSDALSRASGLVDKVILASLGCEELLLVETLRESGDCGGFELTGRQP